MAEWLTLDEIQDWWRDAPADLDLLELYLSSTVQQILAYGPKAIADAIAADPLAVPDNYRLAELVQVRNIWNAVKSDPASQGIGDEGFVFRPFPMDWTVKQIIRPQHGKPDRPMTIREDLIAVIAAAAPAGTHVIPYQDNVDVMDAVTIMFKQLTMLPLPEAPRGAVRVNYVLTIVSPATDPAISEAELDEYVPGLLLELNPLDWFAWETAEKVLGPGGMSLAYDVTCWTIAQSTTLAAPLTPPITRKRKG